MRKLTYFVDLDDVLVDFQGAMARRLGCSGQNRRTEKEFWDAVVPGNWEMHEALNECLGSKLTNASMMDLLIGDDGFWERLPALPHYDRLLDLVTQYSSKWYIVTAAWKCPSSAYGKLKWARNNFGPDFDRLIPTRHKEELAGPGKVLVDDREETVKKFREAGGLGIVFPTALNLNYPHKDSPLAYVKHEMDAFALPQNWFNGRFSRNVEPDDFVVDLWSNTFPDRV